MRNNPQTATGFQPMAVFLSANERRWMMLIIEIHVDRVEEATSNRASKPKPGVDLLRKRLMNLINRLFKSKKRGEASK